MTDNTKLGSREVSKSREHIAGLATSLPILYSEYSQLQKLADAEKNENVKKILRSGASGIFLKYSDQRNELVTRLAEVSAEIAKDAETFAKFVQTFLPYFPTQQEIASKKAK